MKHTKEALRRQRPTWALIIALGIIMAITHSASERLIEDMQDTKGASHGRP